MDQCSKSSFGSVSSIKWAPWIACLCHDEIHQIRHTKDNIDIFALVSGDSDFSPLVSKLKENNKRVVGCGIKSSTSNLLVGNCDEFIYYDDLVRAIEAKLARGEAIVPRGGAFDTSDSVASIKQIKGWPILNIGLAN